MSVDVAPTVATQATHDISRDEVRRWLAEHGLNADDVMSASVEIGYGRDVQVNAWLDVEWLCRDGEGRPYRSASGDGAATGHSTVPLRSWPTLTPVEQLG